MLTAVLFTDIVGSTKMAVDLGDRRWGELLDRHDEVIHDALLRFRGPVVKGTGDGVLATFDGPGRAIRCAEAITHSVKRFGIEVGRGCTSASATCAVRPRRESPCTSRRIADLADSGEILVADCG